MSFWEMYVRKRLNIFHMKPKTYINEKRHEFNAYYTNYCTKYFI